MTAYGAGTFCLTSSPGGINYIFSVADDGALIPNVGIYGTPAPLLYVGGYQISCDDYGALTVAVSAVQGAQTHTMLSPFKFAYSLSVWPSDTSVHITPVGNSPSVNIRTVYDLIRSTLRAIHAVASGEPLDADEAMDAMQALNTLKGEWNSQGCTIYANVTENFPVAAGVAAYTMGPGGDWDTDRPEQIMDNAFVRDSGGTDYDVTRIGEDQYNGYSVKSTSSRPSSMYLDPTWPLATLYFYPTPDAVYYLYLSSIKPMPDFTSLQQVIQLPGQYLSAFKWNLALELAPEYERQITPWLLKRAAESLRTVKTLNAALKLESTKLNVFGVGGVAGDVQYLQNIYSDVY